MSESKASPGNRIDRSLIDDMFENITHVYAWDVDGDLVWGYFFTSTDKAALSKVADTLVQQGYDFVDIWESEREDGQREMTWLHVQRVEHHTADSLFARNDLLYDLAAAYPPVVYDGMDAGKIDQA